MPRRGRAFPKNPGAWWDPAGPVTMTREEGPYWRGCCRLGDGAGSPGTEIPRRTPRWTPRWMCSDDRTVHFIPRGTAWGRGRPWPGPLPTVSRSPPRCEPVPSSTPFRPIAAVWPEAGAGRGGSPHTQTWVPCGQGCSLHGLVKPLSAPPGDGGQGRAPDATGRPELYGPRWPARPWPAPCHVPDSA